MGKVTYFVAISLTLISLVLGQLTAGGQQSQPSKPSPSSPKPTAAWMATQANPLSVEVSLDQGSSATEEVTTRGGEITATAPDGTRFILTIPKNALAQTAEVKMTPVAGIKNLPLSGGLLAAVQITPENLLLLAAPTLVVRPRARLSPAEQVDFASFAYRGNGREFHLYPIDTDPKQITFRLLHFGGFGVGRGTEEEQEKIRTRLPTDSSDRLMMQIQKLKSTLRQRLLGKPVARMVADETEWRVVNASFETAPPQGGELTAQMRRDIVDRLREAYQQWVLPKLKSVKFECRPEMLNEMNEAIDAANNWMRAVDLLGLIHRLSQEELTSEEIDTLIRDRVSAEGLVGRDYQNRIRNFNRAGMVVTETELRRLERDRLRREGYNDQETEDMLKDSESIRTEFQPMYDELNRVIWDTLKKAYEKSYQCCMKEAKDYYLAMMDALARQLSISGQDEAVSMEKRNECLCAIESVSAGPSGAWSGEITHTESFVDEKDETIQGGTTRHTKYYKKHNYRAVINLVYHQRSVVGGPTGSNIPAQVSASGSVDSSSVNEDHGVSASMDKRWGTESTANYSGNVSAEDTNVEVQVRPDGTYNVSYVAPCVDASGLDVSRTYVEGTGFPEFQKKNDTRSRLINRGVCPTQSGVHLPNGQIIGITGQLDPKNLKATITGSKTFEVPLQENPKVNKRITITWKLKRCR